MTEGNRNQKQSGFEVKTFPVPFAIGEIRENLSITKNTPSKLSKEEIANQAIQFHLQGNISEAGKYYQYFINQGFKDHKVFSNYGIILKDLGKSREAEILLRKAIELKPNSVDAYLNLGTILKDLGKLKEAEKLTRKAIDLNPNLAKAYLNLGIILEKLREFKEAELSTRKAIDLNPDLAEAYLNLGIILQKLREFKEAEISTRKAIELNSNLVEAHLKLGEILFESGKIEESSIVEWNAIKMNPLNGFLKSYRENAKIINKTAFFVFSHTIFNHFKPIIELNPSIFEIVVPDYFDKKDLLRIRNDLKNKEIKIRTHKELFDNNLLYEKLVSNRGSDKKKIPISKNNIQTEGELPIILLLGKKNIKFMYTAGKNKYTINSYWNKHYDGILCYGPYHEKRFKLKHKIPTSQMGYPRFDKYFNPGFKKNDLIQKFNCEPKKKTIVWMSTWSRLSSIDKYLKVISSLRIDYNIVVRPHPSMKETDPRSYKKLFTVDFNYIDDNEDDNVQLYALADLMFFDYGGPMFGALYLNKNFAFLDMKSESKNDIYLGESTSEDYFKSLFPDRIAKLENLSSICNYCMKNSPSDSVMKSLREEFFNLNYQGYSAKRAYELLRSNEWLK